MIARTLLLFCCFCAISINHIALCDDSNIGIPLKFISGCELDINQDNENDMFLLLENKNGLELIALINKHNTYETHTLYKGKGPMYLSCKVGKEIRGTLAGKGNKKESVYTINGIYVQLTQPESSSVVFFWVKEGFKKIWTSD